MPRAKVVVNFSRVSISSIFRLRREIFRVHTCARSPATASVAQWIERCFPKARVVGSIPIRGIFCFLPPRPPTTRPRGGDVDAPDAPVAARELAGIEETRRVFAAWAPALFSFPFFFFFVLFFAPSARRTSRARRFSRFSRPFAGRSHHRECRVVVTLKRREERVLRGRGEDGEASLYRRRDDERIGRRRVAFVFLHPRARASARVASSRFVSRTMFTRTMLTPRP